MTDAAANSPRRRKRFQFSLRTLMIGVLVYGALWLMTVKGGANRIARAHGAAVLAHLNIDYPTTISTDADGGISVGGEVNGHLQVRIAAEAIAPFLLSVRIESDHRGTTQRHNRAYYFWFFGYCRQVAGDFDFYDIPGMKCK